MSAELEQNKQELSPVREITTFDGYRFFIFDETQTILPHVCLEDPRTGVIVSTTLANKDKRVAAIKAWSGARHSREPGMSWGILHQMLEDSRVDPDKKVSDFFHKYGHASPADMAPIGIHVERVPMHVCLAIFNNFSLNSGQEKSTRFQMEFDTSPLQGIFPYLPEGVSPDLFQEVAGQYAKFEGLASLLFTSYRQVISERFKEKFAPENEKEKGALTVRTLDTARVFLLFGQLTGQYVGETARNWARLIGEMKASPISFYRGLADQIQRLLAPTLEEEEALGFKAEAPSLIRHTEAAHRTNVNLMKLKDHLSLHTDLFRKVSINRQFRGEVGQSVTLLPKGHTTVERMVAQYILSLYPGLERKALFSWVSGQSDEKKKEISNIVLTGHDNYHEIPAFGATSDQTLVIDASLAEVRDLNRHRAWARFVEIPAVFGAPMDKDTFIQILSKGFVLPAHLTEIEEFADLREAVTSSIHLYYESLHEFLRFVDMKLGDSVNYALMLNLLPLCHHVPLWMHGDPKQAIYMPGQRVRPGGQINYRILAWEANQLLASSDPYLEAIRLGARPDLGSREEFFDRS